MCENSGRRVDRYYKILPTILVGIYIQLSQHSQCIIVDVYYTFVYASRVCDMPSWIRTTCNVKTCIERHCQYIDMMLCAWRPFCLHPLCRRMTICHRLYAVVFACVRADVSMCQHVAVGEFVVSASVRVNNRQHNYKSVDRQASPCVSVREFCRLPHDNTFGNPGFDLDPALQEGIERPN